MRRLLVINPNTNEATTRQMVAIARAVAGSGVVVEGVTASVGARVITEPAALAVAAGEVARMAGLVEADGVVVAAFGDPGLAAARAVLGARVTGLAEASIGVARGRRFAIVTTTPALDSAIRERVAASGAVAAFAGTFYTRSGPAGMDDPARLEDELAEACGRAATTGAESVIFGGGPLAAAARQLRGRVGVAVVEPIPAAVRLLLGVISRGGAGGSYSIDSATTPSSTVGGGGGGGGSSGQSFGLRINGVYTLVGTAVGSGGSGYSAQSSFVAPGFRNGNGSIGIARLECAFTSGPSHRPPTTDHRPPTTDHRPPTTDHRPPTTDHRPPTTDPRASELGGVGVRPP